MGFPHPLCLSIVSFMGILLLELPFAVLEGAFHRGQAFFRFVLDLVSFCFPLRQSSGHSSRTASAAVLVADGPLKPFPGFRICMPSSIAPTALLSSGTGTFYFVSEARWGCGFLQVSHLLP